MSNDEFYTVRGYQLLKHSQDSLTSAMEDYLEMIYRNSQAEGYIRVNTLAELLNVKASSTTKMVQKLARLELLNYQKYGIIQLTDKGRQIGEFLLNRHNIIAAFLTFLGVKDRILPETELIEHNISVETVQEIDLLNKFFDANPEICKSFEQYRRQNIKKLCHVSQEPLSDF